ncbi:MAG: glycosyltransferase [Candidatus Margulisbacteria bacterium]|jgi:glycosyltransferase involved in cell wall biosynthesis|nr:glycosyltransferase [Candidatus Margulisiibacteriota bacterium]
MKKKLIVQLFFSYYPINFSGGVEKVLATMSNLGVQKGYQVIDICNDAPGKKLFFPLDKRVKFYNLGLLRARIPLYKRIITVFLRKLCLNIKNPTDTHAVKLLAAQINRILKNREVYAFICYSYRDAVIASLLASSAPKILMDHGGSSAGTMLEIDSRPPVELSALKHIAAFQTLMPGFVKQAKKLLSLKTVCIPNIVPQVKSLPRAKQVKAKKIIINIGRMNKKHKCQHLLVEAFAKIPAEQRMGWELHLYGEAQTLRGKIYQKSIERLIKKQRLSSQVFLKGLTKEPLKVLQNADICGFPSAYEGFGLSLAEAMSAGLPAVGFSYAPAVNELIKDGQSGFLCRDVDDYSDKLALLLKDGKLREKMGKNAQRQMREYSADKIWAKWEKLFAELTPPAV